MAECTAAYGDKEIASLLMAPNGLLIFLLRTYERHRPLLIVCRTMNKVSIVWCGELQRPLLLLAISPTSGTLPHLERQVEGKGQQPCCHSEQAGRTVSICTSEWPFLQISQSRGH